MTALQLLINNCFITVGDCILLTIMVFAGVFLIIWHFSSLTEPQRCPKRNTLVPREPGPRSSGPSGTWAAL